MSQLPNIADLSAMVNSLHDDEQERFHRIFRIHTAVGELCPPPAMNAWLKVHFGSVEAVRKQRIVKVTNLITVEGSLFNELRASRPVERYRPGDLETTIEASRGDSFCHPLTGTPEDVFGRVQGKRCVTASNVAKYDGFHGLVVFDQHNPLIFDAQAVSDYIDTALAWARRAHCEDRSARYFFLLWNCLWRSGASILHGHAQMALGRGMHYARVEHARRAALLYRIGHGVNYFEDLFLVHQALGLAVQHGSVQALAYLTPVKEKEIVILSPSLDASFKDAIFKVLRCFVHELGVTHFNLALWMKPIDSVPEDWSGFPFIMRLVDRGQSDSQKSDIGAMELYGSSVISSDPFQVAGALRGALDGEG
jgi:hypothetical protein